MLISESVLKRFQSNIILEAGLPHLKNTTTSVKIITHCDLDGIVSAITMVNAYEKRGIPKNRIQVEFAQYGDNQENLRKKLIPQHSKQEVIVTDFAKLPTTKVYDLFKKLTNFKADKNKSGIVSFINSRDFSKMSEEEFKKLISKSPLVDLNNDFAAKNVHDLYIALGAYSIGKKKDITVDNIDSYRVVLNRADRVEDHHDNSSGALSGGDRGEIAIHSPSESSHLAKKFIPSMWSKEDMDAVDMVDSAGYTPEELQNTIFLKKNFTGPGKKRGLATIINTVVEQVVKKDEAAAKWIVLHTGTNLINLYTNILKTIKFNSAQLEMLKALQSGDTAKVSELAKQLPPEMQKTNKIFDPNSSLYKGHERSLSKIMTTDEIRKKNIEDLKKTKTGYLTKKEQEELEKLTKKKTPTEEETERIKELSSKQGKIIGSNNFAMQNAQDLRNYPSRYMGSLYSEGGKTFPFTLKRYSSFIQAAKSPLYKGKLDFAEVAPHVYKDIEDYLRDNGVNQMKIDNIMDNMKYQSGGHGAIFSIQGFDKITMPSKSSGPYYDAKKFIDRAEAVAKNRGLKGKDKKEFIEKIAGSRKETFKEIEKGDKAKYEKIKQGCIEHAIKSIVKWTNKLFPVSAEDMEKLKTSSKTFELEK